MSPLPVIGRRGGRPHCMLLSFHFPPGRGSGVYRIRAWANHLVRTGWDVTVVTVDRGFYDAITGSPDYDLLETVDERVRLAFFKFPYEYLRQDVREMSWAHANLGPAYLRAWRKWPQEIFPEVYGHALPIMVARGLAVAARKRVDLVLATGNPYAQYGAAWALGTTLRVPYAVDFHDPWTLDLWKEQDAFPPGHAAWTWEKRIVDNAALTITVNEPLVRWYQERYPEVADRIRLVELGFDQTVVTDPGFRPYEPGRPLHFGFVGTIRGDLPLDEFLAGWALARKDPMMAKATMTFYGYLGFFRQHETAIRTRFREYESLGVRLGGPVPQTRLTEVYSQLDALAMLLTSSRYVTAGKGYDYMASGRPVVGVHDPRNHTSDVFADYPSFFPVSAVTPEAIAAALLQAARAVRDNTPQLLEQRRAVALTHTWDAAIAPVAAELEGLVR